MDNDYELHSRIWRQLSQMLGEISRPGTPKTVFTQEQRMNQMLRFVQEHYNESLTVDQPRPEVSAGENASAAFSPASRRLPRSI